MFHIPLKNSFLWGTLNKNFLVEVNPPQNWPWKQNGTTVVAVMILEVVNNWRSVLQIFWKNRLWTLITFCYIGYVCYYYNTWVIGVYMAYVFDWNSGGKTSQIEWWFESNIKSSGYF